MRPDKKLKLMRILLAVSLTALLPLFFLSFSCGDSATGAPPVYLPAPTGGYINTTSPDANGNVMVYGYIYAEGLPVPDAEVAVNNATSGTSQTATADANAFFSVTIGASVGDSLSVSYTDPATGQTSEATTVTVTNETQAMSSTTMIQKDMDIDTNDGLAVIVANDGTNSEIVEINLATGSVQNRATFHSITFERVAVHSGLNYAAVLDTANNRLFWYDLANLADDMAETSNADISADSHDVAVANLEDTPYTTEQMVVVSHDLNINYGFLSIYGISSGATPALVSATTNNCIGHPSDTIYYPNCSGSIDRYTPVAATRLDMVKNAANQAYLAVVVGYDNNGDRSKVVHFVTFFQGGLSANISLDLTLGEYFSELLDAGVDPYDIDWYNDTSALMTDSGGGSLFGLTMSGTDEIDSETLAIGTGIRGVASDSDNSAAYIADQSSDSILKVDMTAFAQSGTTYPAIANPTEIGYYTSGDTRRIGAILTTPESLFKTIDVAQ